MRLHELFLIEYKQSITGAKFGDKLVSLIMSQERTSSIAKQLATLPDQEQQIKSALSVFEEADPTTNKQYVVWLIKQYMRKTFRVAEDMPQINRTLTAFEHVKRKLPVEQRDIGKLDLAALRNIISKFEKQSANQEKEKEQATLNREDVKILYNGPEGRLTVPLTAQASCDLFSKFSWCSAFANNDGTPAKQNRFDRYNKSGQLYVWQDKTGSYQLSFAEAEFMDENDNRISTEKLKELAQMPVLKDLFDKHYNADFRKWRNMVEEDGITAFLDVLLRSINNGEAPDKLYQKVLFLGTVFAGKLIYEIDMGGIDDWFNEGPNIESTKWNNMTAPPILDILKVIVEATGIYPKTMIEIAKKEIQAGNYGWGPDGERSRTVPANALTWIDHYLSNQNSDGKRVI